MWFWIALGCAVFLAGWFALRWQLSNLVINPKPSLPMEGMKKAQFELYGISDADWEQNWRRREFTLQSRYGYPLACMEIPRREDAPPPDGQERVVVVVHGHGVSHYYSVKYARMFHELGLNVVLYDHRNHGNSGKALTTMGHYEAQDLCTVCQWARERFGANCMLGTHGESMGAATVMLHSAIDHSLAFVIEDCGYSNLRAQIAYVMKTRYHLPTLLFLPSSLLLAWMRTGVRLSSVRPDRAVAQSGETPMLFLHGEADTYVPYSMLEENYRAKQTGLRQKHSFPGAEHARSFYSDPDTYYEVVRDFLRAAGVL